jgi:Flp pilus assembly protein TadB
MPTRKQRRRQAKERRHEYEYVYVDESGREVEVDEPEPAGPAKDGQRAGSKAGSKAGSRPGRTMREPPEPSWSRSVKRAIPWQIGIFLLVVFVLRSGPVVSRVVVAILYGALFIPLMYMTDRMMRNRWLKQQGAPPPKDKRSRR